MGKTYSFGTSFTAEDLRRLIDETYSAYGAPREWSEDNLRRMSESASRLGWLAKVEDDAGRKRVTFHNPQTGYTAKAMNTDAREAVASVLRHLRETGRI